MHSIESPLQSRLVSWQVRAGDHVRAGDLLVILEAMKMEHELRAPTAGRVAALLCELGEMVESGQELLRIDDLPLTSGTAGAPADAPTPTPASPVAPRSATTEVV